MKAKRMAAVLLAVALTIPCWNLGAKAAFSDVPSKNISHSGKVSNDFSLFGRF